MENSGLMVNSSSKQNSKIVAFIALTCGIIFLSFSPLFVRWADSPGIVISFYRFVIVTIVLAPFFIGSAKKFVASEEKFTLRYLWFPVFSGIFSALDQTFWSTAINHTTVATATLLNYIAPLWVSLVAMTIFKEKFHKYYWAGLFSVLIGAIFISGIITSRSNTISVFGEGFALLSSLFYAGYFIFTQKSRTWFSVVQHMWLSAFFSSLTLGLIILFSKTPIIGYSNATYIYILLAAILCQLGGYYCITYALGKIPATIVSPFLVLQPVTTAILAIPFVHEMLTWPQILGGSFVIAGIYLVNQAQQKEIQKS